MKAWAGFFKELKNICSKGTAALLETLKRERDWEFLDDIVICDEYASQELKKSSETAEYTAKAAAMDTHTILLMSYQLRNYNGIQMLTKT